MDELDDTLALLGDLELLVASGRIAVEAEDDDTPVRFRPTDRPDLRYPFDVALGTAPSQRDAIIDPRD
jgi:hypothetical protein